MNKNNNSFMFYPDITDEDFNKKIYLKKEFRDTEIKEKTDWNKNIIYKNEFTLDPHQIFLKNYISPDTPYNGVLVFHGTGVGKTCTAISIAEGFKKTLKNMNKKILVLSNLGLNFIKELYNFRKERSKKNPEDIVQCTGKEYELGEQGLYLTQQQKEREITKLKKYYYQFYGYKRFANDIIKNTGGWKGGDKDINEKIKKYISKEFDDRVIIIDEIQNIKTDTKKELTRSIQPILQSIIKYGKNIKLVMMSATPMFDRPDEIIFYINLLLQNDGRELINKNDIFNFKDGTLKPDAEQKLKNIFKGYISYVRAEKPFIFPFRIYPKESTIPNKINYYMSGQKIDDDKKIKYTKLILCPMKSIQENTYIYYFDKKLKDGKIKQNINDKNLLFDLNNINNINTNIENVDEKKGMGLLFDLTKISNITYPIADNENSKSNKLSDIGSFNNYSIEADFDNGLGGYYRSTKIIGQKKKIQYKYQSHAIFDKDTINEEPFADETHLCKYSTKFASILETIKKSKGLIFVFSQYIEQGTLPFALMLEQNGFDRECTDGEEPLLDYNANKLKGGGKRRNICFSCGLGQNADDHFNEKSKKYHIYRRAKYILYFGKSIDIVKVKREDALNKFTSNKNKYGEEIKVFIGTRAVSEGLDFKRIRQVHIIEPWYNLSRHEQIIGRAIRNLSHQDLLPEERNVEIYQYASILDNLKKSNEKIFNTETIDLKNYRVAEYKDIIIKNISRIMKESAVDCVLFRNTNIIESDKKVKQITSSGQVLNVPIQDKPYTSICDYKDKCNYTCNWSPNPRIKYPINTDTYNIKFASNDILKVKKYIKNLFRENIVYYLDSIINNINKKHTGIDKLFIYAALEELVDNKDEVVYDKFSRKGYIIYRGDYYVFQPFDLDRDEIPIIYRMYPSDIKTEYVDLENIELNYSYEKNKLKKEKNDDNKILLNTTKNISNLYNLHIEIDKTKTEKYYLYSIIGSSLDKLNRKNLQLFIQKILIKFFEKSNEEYINDIIHFLNSKHKLINYYADIEYDKTKIKNNLFVGFIMYNDYYIIESINNSLDINSLKNNKIEFIECSKDIISKIKSYRSLQKINNKNSDKESNTIYGIMAYDSKKQEKKFKIIDKSFEEEILTKEKKKSKRSIITGRMCSTFEYSKLLDIRKKVGMYKLNEKKRIEFLCEDLEIYFRYKELLSDDNKLWFVD